MAVLRCQRDVAISNMIPVLDRAEDRLRSVRCILHEFKEMDVAIKAFVERMMSPARKNHRLLNAEDRDRQIDAEYLGPVGGHAEDPSAYDERRKIEVLTWIREL
jgi:hypothetical protein